MFGSCLDRLKDLEDCSVDAVVTDPPYELGFMGKSWDSSGIAYNVEVWAECLRVLKPGGHILAFSGTRTYHRMTVAIEDAGFEIRDMVAWISNKTFPKSHNVYKSTGDDAWQGWGTALKPSLEPVVMARKSLDGTVADNVLKWDVGGLNIDGTRIGSESVTINTFDNGAKPFGDAVGESYSSRQVQGRWPSNVMLDQDAAAIVDSQSGQIRLTEGIKKIGNFDFTPGEKTQTSNFLQGKVTKGGASRFFYVARASKRDRNEGLEALLDNRVGAFNGNVSQHSGHKIGANPNKPNQPGKNFHPTVKPTDLMRQLVRLVTPPGGLVLDPFTGSGSTGKAAIFEGFRFVGVELTEEYLPIIEGRLSHAVQLKAELDAKDEEVLF